MERGDVRKCKKKLNILEIAATDKENLTSKIYKKKMNPGNTKQTYGRKLKKTTEVDSKSATQITNNINKRKKDQSTQSTTIIQSDDLTVDNPSEDYWKNLAESRRRALETALKENVDLHNKVNELEYENSRLKTLLDEAKSLVEVLTEMMEDNSEEEPKKTEEKITTLEESSNDISDSDLEHMSFQSCL